MILSKIIVYFCLVAFSKGYFTRPPSTKSSEILVQEEKGNTFCPQECSCSWYKNTATFKSIKCSLSNDQNPDSSDLNTCVPFFNTSTELLYNLASLSIEGCSSLTNLTSFPLSYSLTLLKLSHGNLAQVSKFEYAPYLENLDLSWNHLRNLPIDFFQDLTYLQSLDLSGNDFVHLDLALFPPQIFELKIDDLIHLESLEFSAKSKTELKTISAQNNVNLSVFCPWILWNSPLLQDLNLKNCPKLDLYHRIFKSNQKLENLQIDHVFCDCSPPRDIEKRCLKPLTKKETHVDTFRHENCLKNRIIQNQTDLEVEVFSDFSLDCGQNLSENLTHFMWITPKGTVKTWQNPDENFCRRNNKIIQEKCFNYMFRIFVDNDEYVQVLPNGTLQIRNFGWLDRGNYECLAYDELARFTSSFTQAHLEPTFRQNLYYLSLVYGFATAGGFLLITLLFKLIHFLLLNYGCCLFCCCCKDQLPPKAKRLKSALESIEAYRGQQLGKLQENYAQQSEWIRQNCAVQMERVRENYNWQVQNLRDIRHYGSNQVTAVRDQYFEQMARIRNYSTTQLQGLHENYYFQRQRLRKFNAQNYLKMRETRQYTRRTLQKVMENLPALYLDLTTCRQGLGERQGSMEWDPNVDPSQILELEKYHQKRMQNMISSDRHSESLYFTPSGTPMREFDASRKPYNDADAYSAVYYSNTTKEKTHQRVKSFSHFLPGSWFLTGNTSKEVKVEVVIENSLNNDYFDIDKQPDETDQLLSSQASSSVNSSNEKKSTNGSSSMKDSKKTLMTNLSGMKSEIDLSAQLLSNETRRKSL